MVGYVIPVRPFNITIQCNDEYNFSEFNLRRHVSCEYCDGPVTGGYDQELNQVLSSSKYSTKTINLCERLNIKVELNLHHCTDN